MVCAELWRGEGEWLDNFSRGDEEGKVALLLGKGMKGVCNREMAEVGSTVIWLDR